MQRLKESDDEKNTGRKWSSNGIWQQLDGGTCLSSRPWGKRTADDFRVVTKNYVPHQFFSLHNLYLDRVAQEEWVTNCC